jgi:hypothetical protein
MALGKLMAEFCRLIPDLAAGVNLGLEPTLPAE